MSVTVMIPTALRLYAEGEDTVELSGATVGDVLDLLTERYPKLRPHLFGDDGQLRNFVNVFVNDENIRDGDRVSTTIKSGDEVAIVPAVAGGNSEELSKEERERYARHIMLPEVGAEGQKKLKASSVLLVGAGGLGSPLAMYLAAAGIGRIGIVEFDVVDFSNLQRQVIHTTADVGKPKIESARESILAINPNVQVDMYPAPLTSANALDVIRPYDVVIDGTDNFPTRYLVNDACVLLGKPNPYGSIFRFDGQASVFNYDGGPCYRCLYPEPPDPGLVPSCAEGGVLGVLPGIIGVIQATEAVKIILGQGKSLSGRLMLFDALGMKFREMKIKRDKNCPLCGDNPTITELIDYKEFCGMPAPDSEASKIDDAEQSPWDISCRDLKDMRDRGEELTLLDVRNPNEYEICDLGGLLMPLAELPARFDELEDEDALIVVHCKIGGRSAQACDFLRQAGYTNVHNLRGGIQAWAEQIDPNVPKY